VYVTHDQIEAMALADKIVLLHAGAHMEKHGSIAQIGAPLDLYHRPKSRFVAGFIGSPKMNFLPARVLAADERGIEVELTTGERIRAQVDGRKQHPGAQVTLGIRPEHLSLAASQPGVQTIRCAVRLVERMGEHSYVHLDGGARDGNPMIAKLPGDGGVTSDERIELALAPNACHVFDGEEFALPRLH
jgi:multiple sugar transport system ATP-binding protein